jgi:hypothetical protein
VVERERRALLEGRCSVPAAGSVVAGRAADLPFVVMDADGREVESVSAYLRDLVLGDASRLTCRSYAFDLLRWHRLLWMLRTPWEKATEAEVAVLVGWLRQARNPQRRRRSPDSSARVGEPQDRQAIAASGLRTQDDQPRAHRDQWLLFVPLPLRGRPGAQPRPGVGGAQAGAGALLSAGAGAGVPQGQVAAEGAGTGAARDARPPVGRAVRGDGLRPRPRAAGVLRVLRCQGERAAGVGLEDIDWAGQLVYVVSKGTRERQAVPASPDAFRYLGRYLAADGLPAPGQPVWRTRRGEQRPLTYWAMRRILRRANDKLGTNWTLHDARHTAATRMAGDERLTLAEVQAILRHAHLDTTGRYLTARVEDMHDKLAEHYSRPRPQRVYAAGYDPEDIKAVFGA